jgi:hypothetical protein
MQSVLGVSFYVCIKEEEEDDDDEDDDDEEEEEEEEMPYTTKDPPWSFPTPPL